MGGGDLPLGVAEDGGGLYPAALPKPRQGDHHRKEGRLDDVEAIQPGACAAASQDLPQGPVDVGAERLFALGDVVGEGR